MTIGICGLIGSGKGTVADFLVNEYGYTKLSFADKLKDGVASIFGWDRAMLEGDTNESRQWREVPDEFWTKETGKEITPRLVLQLFGTDCMRNGFYDGVWVSLAKQTILNNPDTKYVLPDTRFANEIEMIKQVGGQVWWVKRGELPEWWTNAVLTNNTPHNEEYIIYDKGIHMEVAYPDVHPSEWKWANTNDKFNSIIYNDTTLDTLYEQTKLKIADIGTSLPA